MVRLGLSGHRQNLRRGPSSCIHANPRRICLVLFHFTIPPSPRLPVIGTKSRSDLEPSTRHRLLGAFFETSIFGPQGTWCSTKLLAFTSALLAPPLSFFPSLPSHHHHHPPSPCHGAWVRANQVVVSRPRLGNPTRVGVTASVVPVSISAVFHPSPRFGSRMRWVCK